MMMPPMVTVTVPADVQLDARTISVVVATAVMMVPMAVTVAAMIAATPITIPYEVRGGARVVRSGHAYRRRGRSWCA